MSMRIKSIVIIIAVLLVFVGVLRADLLEVYKKGEITLENAESFARNTDWEALFSDYKTDYSMKTTMGVHKRDIWHLKALALSDSGNVYVSNYSQLNLFHFDKNGNYVKTFGQRKNKAQSPLNRRPKLSSCLDNKYLVVNEFQGRIGLYNLDGTLFKLMNVDYPVMDAVAMRDNRIAIMASVPYEGVGLKNVLIIKDILTEEETQVTYKMDDSFNRKGVHVKKGKGMIGISGPFSRGTRFICRTSKGNVMYGNSVVPKIRVYSPEGQLVKTITLDVKPLKVSESVKREYMANIEASFKKHKLSEDILEKIEEKKEFFPEYTPYFYKVMVDSDDNILVFTYTKGSDKGNLHEFRVYTPDGEYVCTTKINPGKYDLKVSRKQRNMVFHNGSLYGLFQLKEAGGTPMRLVKVKLASQQ
ncbi:MAG: hypothetical protein GY765_02750 [bacterium]|nr:hypothetical protein [bacterium]